MKADVMLLLKMLIGVMLLLKKSYWRWGVIIEDRDKVNIYQMIL